MTLTTTLSTTLSMTTAIIGVGLLLLGGGCGGLPSECKKDTDCKGDRICNMELGECVSPGEDTRRPGKDAGASVKLDTSVAGDGSGGSWICYLGNSSSSQGYISCSWDWLCTNGDRSLLCGWSSSSNKYKCSCKNIKEGKVEGSFYSDDICSLAKHNAAYRANKNCGWKLPTY